ncbi:MAG: Uma2 family endonuclease [Pseudonocardia sp.]
MTLSWPNHLLTLEEWEALPEDEVLRLELVEGVLVMSPQPLSWHQRAVMRVGNRADEQLPPELIALTGVEVVLAERPLTIRVPDMMVTRTELFDTNPPRFAAANVLLVVEVLSDGTRRVDQILKFSEYADAGILQYWIIDLGEPTSLLAYVLAEGAYALSGEHTGTITLDVAGCPVLLDLDALTRC